MRRKENSSFANFGSVSACVVCKCAVLCVGSFKFSCRFAANYPLCLFLGLLVTTEAKYSAGLRKI